MFTRKSKDRSHNRAQSENANSAKSGAAQENTSPRTAVNKQTGSPKPGDSLGSALESLSIDLQYATRENVEAADYYRQVSTARAAQSAPRAASDTNLLPSREPPPRVQSNSTMRAAATPRGYCRICLVDTCVMDGGSLEAKRLKDAIAETKAARSRAHAVIIGTKFMAPYNEAFDGRWNQSSSETQDQIRANFALPDGKLFAEVSLPHNPLFLFSVLGKTELVAILLHEGAGTADLAGTLRVASPWPGNEDVLRLLLAAGADPNGSSQSAGSALHIAASAGNIGAVKLLVEAGADIDAVATSCKLFHSLPVFHIIRASQMAAFHEVINFLVESGAKSDLNDTGQWTPLQYVCVSGSAALARRLVELGVPEAPLQALRDQAAKSANSHGRYTYWAERLKEPIKESRK
ncbi:hypothetical protein DRE_06473 [Drechslerella stenobrocha 248]|uniref:Uncharacterized protein n=1 Tax=Drechslerella stenobrocha 248 TaxID=1043628 RepID=W7I784_9PEZI|nr:hypothetical protein DRE_06473 [Drechslerella stenobrocha 248]